MCNRLGGATASLGFMFSSFAIAQLISNAWLGPLSDAVGGYLCFQFRSLLVVLLVLILILYSGSASARTLPIRSSG